MGALAYPDPPLTDGVVRLRPWDGNGADAAALAEAWADPTIARWMPVPPPARRTVAAAARWIAGGHDRLAAGRALDLVIAPAATETGDADSRRVLGEVGLGPIDWPERQARIGYWVAPSYRGQGLATRAVALVARWTEAELGLRVVAEVDVANAASVAVAERAGIRTHPM